MSMSVPGVHHVTAITADPQMNIDFYAAVLGLRLVKVTVNFDDPQSYHLYYGDQRGSPGSIMTFFAWPGAPSGRIGPPQVCATAFAVPADSIDYWGQRLDSLGAAFREPIERFGQTVLPVSDPDGLELELVGVRDDPRPTWANSPVPARHAIHGFCGVTLAEEGYEKTAGLLVRTLRTCGCRHGWSRSGRRSYRPCRGWTCRPHAKEWCRDDMTPGSSTRPDPIPTAGPAT